MKRDTKHEHMLISSINLLTVYVQMKRGALNYNWSAENIVIIISGWVELTNA